jgi:hypothetical protein
MVVDFGFLVLLQREALNRCIRMGLASKTTMCLHHLVGLIVFVGHMRQATLS